MSDKKIILITLFSFGCGCVVTGQVIWFAIHYWSTWHAWLFCFLGLINVISIVFMIRSHLRWFTSRLKVEYYRGRLDEHAEKRCADIKSDI